MISHNRWKLLALLLLMAALVLSACAEVGPPTEEDAVPAGDPPFPAFTGSWVIDTTGTISDEVEAAANSTLQQLRDDGIAEVVILVIENVDHPELYATRFGRFIKLGSSETNNGLVYLLRPDSETDQHIIYSVGRGLPAFTSAKVTEATVNASLQANSGNFDQAVQSLATDTATVLRVLYEADPEAVTDDGEPEMTEEQLRVLIITIIVIVTLIIVIGVILAIIDPQLGMLWFEFWIRVGLAIATGGKAGGGTGGGGKFGGRSGSR